MVGLSQDISAHKHLSSLPLLRTQNGVLHLQNEDVAQPLSLVLAGLDTVLEILQSRHSLSLVTAISGSAHVRSPL